MLELYIHAIEKDIEYYEQVLGCSKELIVKKIKRKYQSKLADKQTKNCMQIISFILYKKQILVKNRIIQFAKES